MQKIEQLKRALHKADAVVIDGDIGEVLSLLKNNKNAPNSSARFAF